MSKIPYFLTPNIHLTAEYLYYLRENLSKVTCLRGRQEGVEVKKT